MQGKKSVTLAITQLWRSWIWVILHYMQGLKYEEHKPKQKPTPEEFNINNPACNAWEWERNSCQNQTSKELNMNNSACNAGEWKIRV